MVSFILPPDSHLLTNKHLKTMQLQHTEVTSKQQPNQAPGDDGENEILIGAPSAIGGPWVLCRDRQGFPFWLNNTTGQWTYAGASNIIQPPPPPMMYVPQVPQQHTIWMVSPTAAASSQPMVLVSVAAPAASPSSDAPKKERGVKKVESKVLWPKLMWEERWNEEGKLVWIHADTGKLVHNDPYE